MGFFILFILAAALLGCYGYKEGAPALAVSLFAISAVVLFFGWRLICLNRHLLRENEALGQEIEEGEHVRKIAYEKLRNLFDSMREGVYEVDTEGRCTMVNRSCLKILGYDSKKELLGKNIHALIHHSHPDGSPYPENECVMLKVLRDRIPVHMDHEIFWDKEGKAIPVEYWSNPILVDGKLVAAMATFVDISERKRLENELRRLSDFDSLTGLPNRQKLQFDIDLLHPHACAILNIDNFKEINDFFGIASGDTLLRRCGEWLSQMGYSPYRIGGDEFAVLFYEKLSQEQLRSRISELLSALDKERFIVGDETLDMHMSVGVAIGGERVLTRADIAIHIAKERKIPIAFYEEAENIEEQYRVNIAMAGAIHKALEEGRIVCHYQPIIEIATGRIDKYETLVRMIDENGNCILPMQFLPIAKKTKLYSRITKEVIHQACRLFSKRSEEFSLNITIADIQDPLNVQEIISTITRTGTASRIVFEILESEGIQNYSEVAEFIHAVKALGAKIAIDDFGTGYSNFEHVLRLNVDYIKIDGSLIQGATGDSRHHVIVETIVDFAAKIGTKTIAEFVSDEATFNTVKKLGIHYAQGYYTGKPIVIR